jgi:hypothetical protein
MSARELPVIAILGDVNHGKSSVVATLAEDDSVGIGPFPTTMRCERFRVRDLFEFVDTPGFQNAREALEELRGAASLDVFRAFVARHREDRFFVHECRLFEPVLEGASLLYVVDVAQPMEPRHEAEMEILRLTGAPRIALLNQTAEPIHLGEWETRLRQNFSTTIPFDAHRADFANRLALLEALATVDLAAKEKLRAAIAVLQRDRDEKLDTTARLIIDLLGDVLILRHTEALRDPSTLSQQQREMERHFRKMLMRREAEAHKKIVETFAHRLVAVDLDGGLAYFTDDLFAAKTWTLGFSGWSLLAAGAGGGALIGAKVDLLFGGTTWGLGAAIGATLGGGAGVAGSLGVPKLTANLQGKLPAPLRGFTKGLAGQKLTIGPVEHLNFPGVILERALALFDSVSRRAHARRDFEKLETEALRARLRERKAGIDDMPAEVRKHLVKAFADLRKGRFDAERREAAVLVLRDWLKEISR